MRYLYRKLYAFIWSFVYRHCTYLFNNTSTWNYAPNSLAPTWLEETRFIVEDELELAKESRCLGKLFGAYGFFLRRLINIRTEVELSAAKHFGAERIKLGKYVLLGFLSLNTLIGLYVTYSYQSANNEFNLFTLSFAVLSYLSVAWFVFKARAIPLFQTTLVLLIALTTFNNFFWQKWQSVTNSESCYSETCSLFMPDSLFQMGSIKPFLLIFWIVFLLFLTIKNPVKDYLTHRKNEDRIL